MKTKFLFLLLSCVLTGLFAQNELPILKQEAFTIGETIEFYSEVLGENRLIHVYLPQSYHPSEQIYPVIYLLDGSAHEDFIHIAGLVQFGSYFWINMVPESIVVGISNVDRKRDFTFPSQNAEDKVQFPSTGGSAAFMDFVEQELQPRITERYRIDSSRRSLIGQSLGGLLATEILLKRPAMFDTYFIISPSLWWDDESLMNFQPVPYASVKSVYVAVGKEGRVMQRLAKQLYRKLKTLEQPNTRLFFEYFKTQDHGDVLHQAIYEGFLQVFAQPDPKP